MKKRISTLLLALTLVVSLLAACGNGSGSAGGGDKGATGQSSADSGGADKGEAKADGDIPTISLMAICGTIPSDTADIEAALSEITREKIGCNVTIIPIEVGNVAQRLNLLLSGGDATLDVYMAGVSVPYNTVVNNGQAMDLEELMAPYAEEMKKALGENVYNAGYVNGKLYGIGHLLDQASTNCFNLRADIAAEFGYKNGDKIDLATLTDVFQKIRDKYPDTPIIGPMNGGPNIGDSRVDTLGNKLGVLGNFGQDDKVTDYYSSEEYAELVSYFKKWKEMGCYMPDLLNVNEAPGDYLPAEKAFGCFAGHFSAEMNGIWSTSNFGVEIASLQIYDNAVAVTPWGYECINPATKYPDKAAGLIYLMATDPAVEDLLINGIEGKHYQVKEDGTATYVDGKDASTTGWALGYSWTAQNSTLSTPFDYPIDYFDQLKAANKNAYQSKAFGCQFDLTSVSDAVSACTNVVNKYEKPLAAGAVEDFEATLKAFQDELKAAGIDQIIAEKQKQLDEFWASK